MKKLLYFSFLIVGLLFLYSCSEDNTITENESLSASLNKGGGPSANGQGVLIFEGQKQTFSFHAREDKNGVVSGSVQLKYRREGDDLLVHANINCLSIDGNVATMTGVLDEPIFIFGQEWPEFWIRVTDNGEGSKTDEDLFSDFYVAPEGSSCDEPFPAGPPLEIVNGNFQVKP